MKLKLVLRKWQSNLCSLHIFVAFMYCSSLEASFISCMNLVNNDLWRFSIIFSLSIVSSDSVVLEGFLLSVLNCVWLIDFMWSSWLKRPRVSVCAVTQGPTHWNMSVSSLIWEQSSHAGVATCASVITCLLTLFPSSNKLLAFSRRSAGLETASPWTPPPDSSPGQRVFESSARSSIISVCIFVD